MLAIYEVDSSPPSSHNGKTLSTAAINLQAQNDRLRTPWRHHRVLSQQTRPQQPHYYYPRGCDSRPRYQGLSGVRPHRRSPRRCCATWKQTSRPRGKCGHGAPPPAPSPDRHLPRPSQRPTRQLAAPLVMTTLVLSSPQPHLL
ncbi:unnamed protein product [Ectocarpus sp. 12 AP-2014]